jgi:Flp pilus assembly protein TadG
MERQLPPFLRRQDGSVILETALMLVVLLLLIFGMIDFGRVMYTENNLISAAREGARFGAVQTDPPSITKIDSVVMARFNQYTFGGTNLTASNIDVDTSATTPPSYIKVSIKYKFKWFNYAAGAASVIAKAKVSYADSLHVSATYRYESQ